MESPWFFIICTKNESNLTNRYWDMVPDRQKVWTDRRTDGRNGWTNGWRQNYIPTTWSGDNNCALSYCVLVIRSHLERTEYYTTTRYNQLPYRILNTIRTKWQKLKKTSLKREPSVSYFSAGAQKAARNREVSMTDKQETKITERIQKSRNKWNG